MVAVPIALDVGARVTGMREGETRVARVNRAAFQPFRRCERSRISFFVSGNGTFLSNRPENLCLAVDLRPCRRECPSPPPQVRFIGVAITRKFQFILPAGPPTSVFLP